MDANDLKKASKTNLAREIATRSTDPQFYSALTMLPNPDTVLRKLGRSDEVFDAIVSDAHVIGELRSIRAGLLGWEYRLEPGGETPADARALALCETYLAQRPAPGLRWSDTLWNMAQAVFRGFQVHEVLWRREGPYLMPAALLDRPSRRFGFGTESNELRLITREQMVDGVELGPYKWLLTRHMPSHDNPYGVALFSSCFWPYTFKHSGWRYFVKFCEKYGIPKAIGKYPQGTPKAEQDALADALAAMIEDAVAAIQEGGSVELLQTTMTGELVHERMINLANREMSKALTSQTLATEIQGEGSRAASETHRGREEDVNESDRAVIADVMSELMSWITALNIPDAAAPTFEFYQEAEARKEWVEVFDKARRYVDVPVWFAHERLQIPTPTDEDEVLPRGGAAPAAEFAAPCGCRRHDFAAAEFPDQAALEAAIDSIEDGTLQEQAEQLLAPVFRLVEDAGPEQALEHLAEVYDQMDTDALQELLARAIFVSEVWGRLNAKG
jgi:phage gp29-like protein